MFSTFLNKNSRTLLVIGSMLLLLLTVKFIGSDRTASLLATPQCGQIYIFHADNRYAPMRLDSISHNELFFRNYQFVFADAVPKKAQILSEEFDLTFMAIYDKVEIKRLYGEGQLIKIYQP